MVAFNMQVSPYTEPGENDATDQKINVFFDL